jgi:pyruvate/2-oxoglutarate/acetoin dehydrogenase E1 component/TPP-dependent pyruvate/acetoin dehydrogenase alpha subunit
MSVFQSTEELYHTMEALFERIASDQELSDRLLEGEMVVRFRWRDPEGEATIDLRKAPLRFTLGPSDLEPDVQMTQTADVSHQFWLGRLNVLQAIASRKVVSRGSVSKALKLLPAIQPAFALYHDVLRATGRGNLIPTEPIRRRTPWWQRLRIRRDRPPIDVSVDEDWGIRLVGEDLVLPEVGADGPRTPTDSDERAIAMVRAMIRIRVFEEHLARAYAAGELPTEAIHLSTGQEATAVGACMALEPGDTIVTTHRGHGHMLAKGADPEAMLAEIYGKAGGLCGGKGGSMHVTQASVGALGANGIVGASTLIATGAALAARLADRPTVAVAFLGDGATNQGMTHEAMNFAAVFDLPVVFIVENNQYGEFTPLDRHTRAVRLADRAVAYGIASTRVDGNDAEEVFDAVSQAAVRARRGDGPTLVECLTYRWRGHMEGEEAEYRTAEEITSWQALDPISMLAKRLEARQVLSDEVVSEIRREVDDDFAAISQRVKDAPEPPLSGLHEHVFAPEPGALYNPTMVPLETRDITYSEALREALAEELERDERVFLLGEDVTQGGYFAVTRGLEERFPDRILDTPISEYAIVGSAVGAAIAGRRPVAEILFSDFLTCCMDPIVNQAAKLRYMAGGQYALPLVVRTPGGAGLGMAAQHSQSLEPLLTGVPGLIVIAPATPADAKGLLKAAIRSSNPVLFFEHKLLYLHTGPVPEGEYTVPIGTAAVVREGSDVTIVAIGAMVLQALSAAESLAADGVEAEVVDVRTLVPLDTETILRSVAKTGRLVTAEEAPRMHGFGAEIAARVVEHLPPTRLRAAIRRVGAAHVPVPYAKNLEQTAIPGDNDIVAAVRTVMES